MRPTGRLLGLAIGERRALVAEVTANGGRPVVERAGEFVYPENANLVSDAESIGRALGEFLKERGFSTRSAVVGIPGKWLLTKRLEAPAADPDLVAETLRLQAEGEFAADGAEFVFDYAGEASAKESRNVLLMAAPQRQMDQIAALATAARLKTVAVVPFGATLGAVAGRTIKDARLLLFGPGGAEFIASSAGAPRAVRYLGPANSPASHLAGELRRASAALGNGRGMTTPAGGLALPGGSGNGTPSSDLTVWNDAGIESATIDALGVTFGSPLKLGDVRGGLGVTYNGSADAGRFAAPVSLALAGLESSRGRGGLPVDFLHSRLAPPKQVRFQRRTLILAAVGAAIVLLAGAAVWDLRSQQSNLDELEAKITASLDHVKVAQATVAKVSFAKPWSDTNPTSLACLNELTKALPEDGQVFLTSFNLNDTRKGAFAGRANGSQNVLMLLDRLQSSGKFADVRTSSIESPRKAPTKAQPPKQDQPAPPPPSVPQMPQGMPQLPPGMTLPPGMVLPAGAGAPNVVPMSPTLAMVDGEPQANPAAMQAAMAQAMAMAAAGGMPGGPPPGMQPPSGPTPPPSKKARGKEEGSGPGGAGAGAGGAGEVTFVMTFTFVPK